jgi:CHAD domain-containing protein
MNIKHRLLLEELDLEIRKKIHENSDEGVELEHYDSVLKFITELSKLRNINGFASQLIGMYHDYSRILTEKNEKHHKYSAKLCREVLVENEVDSDTIDLICNAIKNHRKKGKIHDQYSELIKDADALSHQEMALDLSENEMKRVKYACEDGLKLKWDQVNLSQTVSDLKKYFVKQLKVIDDDSIHELRVTLRQLQSIVWLLKNSDFGLAVENLNVIEDSLKKGLKHFSKAREIYVVYKNFNVYGIKELNTYLEKKLGKINSKLQDEAEQHYFDFIMESIDNLEIMCSHVNSQSMPKDFIISSYTTLVKDLCATSVEDLHKFRIEEKRYKYLQEINLIILNQKTSLLIKKLHKSIGDWHDAVVNSKYVEKYCKKKFINKKMKELMVRELNEQNKNHHDKIIDQLFEMKLLLKIYS